LDGIVCLLGNDRSFGKDGLLLFGNAETTRVLP
jgi:hypothetical protein